MRIVELILDETEELAGIEAISIVENPAIEEDFVALKNQEFKLAEIDTEKRILMGALLIPNKPIYRKNGKDEYYIYFSKSTVLKASQLFLQKGNQNNSTLEHKDILKGLSLVESWIIEDEVHDKSRKYNMDLPLGTWMGAVKVNNQDVWNEYVKTGKVKGFSIEGYFADKMERPKDNTIKEDLDELEEIEAKALLSEIKGIIRNDNRYKGGKRLIMESYSDYPDAVSNNAKRGRELNEKVGNKCATDVGKIRSATLEAKKPVSVETIKRMYSFLSRAEEYYKEGDNEACGTISYLLWGGKAGKRWAESKLKELGELKLASVKVNDDFAIIMDRLAYSSKEKAEQIAEDIGCEGIHEHDYMDQTWYMPCEKHELKAPCWDGYEMVGFKTVNGKKVPNCVKMKNNLAEVGPRGGVKKSPKAPKSDTPNPNPKGKGTAKGDASTSRGAKVSKKDEATLQKKADEFNEKYKKKLGYGVTVGMLKSVFQRGLGAFNVSSSPKVNNPSQWAQARVNAFLYLVKNGRPQNKKYTTDYDLLPKKHPKSTK
jgi:hypothetical protein|tara:strand:+ start:4149 stop:5774 length:1626 start_codon:yes stop_codon:yes gene_type:complete